MVILEPQMTIFVALNNAATPSTYARAATPNGTAPEAEPDRNLSRC
jgi:hypothetical protein